MSFLPPLPVKRGLTLGFTVLALSLGCSSFSAQGGTAGLGGAGDRPSGAAGTSPGGTSGGDAGGPIGSAADAGSAGESSGGDDSGAANAAGTSSGGASGSVGLGGHGGQPICNLVECFVANTCLDECGGKVVYVGCCACDPPSVSQISCAGGR